METTVIGISEGYVSVVTDQIKSLLFRKLVRGVQQPDQASEAVTIVNQDLSAPLGSNSHLNRPETWEVDGTMQQSDQQAAINRVQSPANIQDKIHQDPPATVVIEELRTGQPWTSGLYEWRTDQTNAILTAICPCVTFGQIAEVVDEGRSSCCSMCCICFLAMLASYSQWLVATEYRTKLRRKYVLVEDPYTDVASHIFCPLCSLCQEYRELKSRGLDPSLGWKGIVAQQQQKRKQSNEDRFRRRLEEEEGDDHGETSTVPPPEQVMNQ
ncbi:unnamed protein product [Linum trigynum]|uniref:Uncharacterized protein n=1 Tax=Linum trigynum TaxID=586398 RepID=A0AAV2FPN4_9ROSI